MPAIPEVKRMVFRHSLDLVSEAEAKQIETDIVKIVAAQGFK